MYFLHRKKIIIYAKISLFISYSEVTVATRSGPYPAQMTVNRSSLYPDQMVDQHLERTSTALNISGDQDTKISSRDRSPVKTSSPRQPSEKDHWKQLSPYNLICCSWNKLLVHLARGELAPRLSLVSPKVFSPFCLQWSFGSLPLSPLACLVGATSSPAISPT